MKKCMSSLLAIVVFVSLCLTGCSQPSIDPPKEYKDPVTTPVEDTTVVLKNVEIQEDEEVLNVIGEMGLDAVTYTDYPTKEYFCPLDIKINNQLRTVYLKHSDYAGYVVGADEEYMINSKLTYESWSNMAATGSSAGSSSVLGGIVDAISGMVGGNSESTSDVVMPEWNTNAESVVEAPMAPSEPFMPGIVIDDLNTSEYDKVKESNYLSVKTSPLSTFAADVDTASYTNFRSILTDRLSETRFYDSEDLHDIRIEEMLNYFDYSYGDNAVTVTEDEKFTISAEIGTTPWNKDTQLLVVNIKAKELPKEEYKGSNLVFLIDTSGSMNRPNKLPLLKESMLLLIERLTENDTVSIVTYSGDSAVLVKGVSGDEKEKLSKIIMELEPYGSTNGEGGMRKAYEIAEKYKDEHSNSRIIMCSDGDLNVGISSQSELYDFVSEKRETGIYLSVLGFGLGNYKDTKMETLADNGNGNYHYIDSLKEGQKVLVEDIMSTLVTLADDVKFQLEFNPEYIKGYRKIGYENRDMANEDFADDTKDGGEVGYGHEVTVVYEIVPAYSDIKIAESDLKYQDTTATGSNDWLTVSIRYKEHGGDISQLVEYVVNEEHFTETPTDDWKFISNVVGFGLVVNNSDYANGLTVGNLISRLNELDLSNDNYKTEFASLVYGYDFILENVQK